MNVLCVYQGSGDDGYAGVRRVAGDGHLAGGSALRLPHRCAPLLPLRQPLLDHHQAHAGGLIILSGGRLLCPQNRNPKLLHPSLSSSCFAFADKVSEDCPRALINRERVGELDEMLRALGYTKGFNFGAGNYRDALYLGDCDAGVWELCRLLGWEQDLRDVIAGSVA